MFYRDTKKSRNNKNLVKTKKKSPENKNMSCVCYIKIFLISRDTKIERTKTKSKKNKKMSGKQISQKNVLCHLDSAVKMPFNTSFIFNCKLQIDVHRYHLRNILSWIISVTWTNLGASRHHLVTWWGSGRTKPLIWNIIVTVNMIHWASILDMMVSTYLLVVSSCYFWCSELDWYIF